MHAVDLCPDSAIYIAGHTFDTAYRNVIKVIMESPEMAIFRPFCTWSGKKLYYKDKVITVLGAKDEGAVGNFLGDTYSLIYCNEMVLFPDNIIQTIHTRLSKKHSMGFAEMNPGHPDHTLKQWINKAAEGHENYYALHFTLEDNPYLPDSYKEDIRTSLTGVYYKRYYLGEWCMAEGAIFDFFDTDIYVIPEPPCAANYWIAGIDYGTNNNFACLIIGVSLGRENQAGVQTWVEKEYVWDHEKRGRQKTNHEYADDMEKFLTPYGIKLVYMDPSALAFKLELQKRGFRVIEADNDVKNGLDFLSSYLHSGKVLICKDCPNLIREIGGYVWDAKASARGLDKPVKKDDHCIDALRYGLFSHKPQLYDPYADAKRQQEWTQNKYEVTRNYNL
jgi:PBSX family phage terminase large subunit